MYERFTDRARRVMSLAEQEAKQFGHKYIESYHILMGLMNEGDGLAAEVLRHFQVDQTRVTAELGEIVSTKAAFFSSSNRSASPSAKLVIQNAMEECRQLRHQYVGTEHLLLGVLREEEGATAQIFKNLGLDRQTIRDEVFKILGHSPVAPTPILTASTSTSPTTAPPAQPELSEASKIFLDLIPLIPPQERPILMKVILEHFGNA